MWLWVALAYPIWQEVDVKAPDAMQQASARVSGCAEVLLHKAEQQGFLADRLPSGRRSMAQALQCPGMDQALLRHHATAPSCSACSE